MQQLTTFLLLLLLAAPASAQWLGLPSPGIPRTADGTADLSAAVPHSADGKVDMSGLWVPMDATGTLFDSSKILGWAQDAMIEQENSFYVNDPRFHCLPSGPSSYPAGRSVGGSRRIVQHPNFIAILNPDMTYRQVFMDGRELEEEPLLPTWMGYSVGHWEGDTLVIESNGFNDQTWLSREGLPHTDQLRITERYRRTDFGHIELEISYDDPGTFTETVVANIAMRYTADTELLEIVCNESETGRSHYSGQIDQAEHKVVEVPISTLKKYVGTFQGLWLGNPITAEVVLEGEELALIRTPRYSDTGSNVDSAKSRLIPQSDVAFDCTCGLGFIFELDANGNATTLSEVHVSGSWPFKRIK